MTKHYSIVSMLCAVLAFAPALGACTDEPAPVNQVQTNLVDKAIFEGEWWYSSTAIDVSYDEAAIFNSAGAFAPFEGSMSTDYGLDFNRSGPNVIGSPTYSFPIARIRWVIDEHYLFAFRSYELVAGSNADSRSPAYRGEPLAVFKIVDHVDTRKDYNTVTGEKTNVTIENKADRKWYERKYARIDWSENLITDFTANDAQANELFTAFQRESTPFFIQEGVNGYPDSYKPQFVRVEDEKDYRFADEWPKDERDKVHYMSFVTKEVWSPDSNCLTAGGTCAAASVTMRNAFLRVPPKHEYAVASMTNREFDHFGIFRSHQPTYARGGEDIATTRTFCTDDAQCAGGGSCDTEQNICVGGLTGDRGETDFLSFYMSRQNLYGDSLTDKECVSDWECDGRHLSCDGIDDAKDQKECKKQLSVTEGSTCDPAARRCTIPVRSRPLRTIEYRLSAHFPPYLVRETFDAVSQWNEALMRGRRAAAGQLPIDQVECDETDERDGEPKDAKKGDGLCTVNLSNAAPVECQNDNPSAFCFCGSPEAQAGRCSRAYDPFETPAQARKRGVPNPYDCYVKGPADVEHPKDYADYKPSKAYAYQFVGKECALTLAANPCDVDSSKPCLELGDLRYQFLTHVQHGSVSFGGVTQPLSDPTTGELVVSNATVAAESIESVGTVASQFFPVLRGDEPEDAYFSGENLRGYYARLGKVDYPVSLAPSGTDGYTVVDKSRPPTDETPENADLFKTLDARVQHLAQGRLDQLKGQEGRVAILSDRLRDLKGTAIAARIDAVVDADTSPAAVAPDGTVNPNLLPDSNAAPTASSTSAAGTPKSIIEESPLDSTLKERTRRQVMAQRNMDDFGAKLYNAQYNDYWARAFGGYSGAEASLRMQQLYHRSVMVHELGHAMGLQHNFAGSLDRNNYHDAYFPIARTLPLPAYTDYDDPAMGGNGDMAVNGAEAQRWAADLRKVRQERLDRGAGNVMTSSIMDYDGDLSSYSGIGRYDAAAVLFSYFDKVESYDAPDPTQYPGKLPDAAANAASLTGITYADSYRRELWTYYRGGETCQSDSDCPNGAGRETSAYQPIAQRCVSNPRTPNTTGSCGDGGCICSNFYDDFDAYSAGTAYRPSKSSPKYAPVPYLYCNDNRVNDLSWCTTFDAGESFQEVIDHYRLGWLQRYPQMYFRNYRRSGPARGYSQSTVVDAVKIYQHLFFRYYYEPTFTDNTGPLGYRDQLFASADVLNWLGEIIAAPDVGSYSFDADAKMYRQVSTDPNDGSGEVALGPGQGFYLWSQYQSGQNGFFRLERAGTFLDKLLAIESLARRDWGLSYTLDERYYTNFYDVFEKEVIDLFGGLILRNPKAYAPRLKVDAGGAPEVSYMSLYRMDMDGSNESRYPEPAIDGTDSEVLRDAAAIQALAQFPIYYDTSFEQRLLVFRTGSGEGYQIPKTRGDGSPTCGYGDDDCAAPDYIVYDSDRLHTTFVAVIIQPNREQGIDEQQLGFELLLKLKKQQDAIRKLEANDDPSAAQQAELLGLRQNLERDESFIDYLIELERTYGISTSLF